LSDEQTPLGRPLIEIDMDKLKALMQLDPKRETAASIMGCSVDTIERRIRESEDLTYMEFKEKYFAKTIMSIKQLAHKLAAEGNEKMITRVLEEAGEWSGKGQGQVQVNVQNNVQNSITIDAVDLEDRIKQIKGE
jgi:DNA-binding transcriptional MocR family regulator